MIFTRQKRATIAKTAIAALTLTLISVIGGVSAQAATTVYINDTDAPLAFVKSNSTNLIGTGTAANDVVLYKTVGTYGGVAIDAVITTLSVSGSISNYDNPGSASTAAGAANNWMINTVGGEARFRFQFFRAGTYTGANTGVPVVLQNVKITSIDLDCSSAAGSYQYTDATGFQKYAMMSPTNLAVQTVASTNRVRFIANKTGSRTSVPEDQVMMKYDAVQSIEFSFGNVVASQTNYFGLVFGGWPNGGIPTEYTNVFNTPPTASDSTINTSNGVATILSTTNFGNYADADNNPFMAVKIGTVTGGTLKLNTTNVTTGQIITVADIEAGKLNFTASGSSTIQFWVYDGLDFSTNPYTITGANAAGAQTITFNNPGTKGVGSGTFASGATASTGLTVQLVSLTPGVCTVSGLDIVPVSAGTCIIVAKQPGDSNVGAAPEVTQEFQIVAGAAPTLTQVITFAQPADQSLDTATVASGATSAVSDSTTLVPVLTSNTPSTCTVNGLTINIVAVGTCTITASQPGTATVAPATNVVRSFNITSVAGGGTVPATQTWGSSVVTGGSNVRLHGYVSVNSATTTYQFCYTENRPAATTTKILVGGSNGSLYCTSTATTASDAVVETADISYSGNSTNASRINSGSTVYFQIIAYHSSSNKVYGQIMQIAQSAGYVKTTTESNLAQTSATLNGTAKNTSSKSSRNLYFCLNATYNIVNRVQLANSDGKCDQKLTSSPANLSTGSSTSSANANVSGLKAATYYYYQLYMVSTKSSSTISYGNIVRFKTSAASPEATTLGTTGYTTTSATLTGSILSNDNSVTPKFCYSETPTATSGVLTESNCIGGLVLASPDVVSVGTAGVNRVITGLTSGKTYYYQTVGVYNTTSKVYGAIKSFTLGAPAATTLTATGVKITSGTSWEAQLNGFINPNGGTSTNYFCISDTNTVTAKGVMTQCVTGGGAVLLDTATAETRNTSGPITLSKTGLNAGVTYYFQAIGRNLSQSPSLDNFGEVLSFITASAPTVTTEDVLLFGIDTATVRGTMTANGALTTGSFCISSSSAATVIDGVLDSCLFVIPSSPTTTSTNSATTGDAVGLSQATTYYYQQIGDNSQGTSYGTIKSFTTLAGSPVVTTLAATNVLSTTSTLNGRVNPGGASTTVKFCYHTSSSTDSNGKITGCTLTDTVTVLSASAGLTTLLKNIDSLTVNTTYYFQVVASNVVAGNTNTTYGAVLSFQTGAPIVQTQPATSVTGTSAVLNGTVKANGSNISAVKFCLATDPTATNGVITSSNCAGGSPQNATPYTFSSTILTANPESLTVTSGISSGTVYYFQISATNGQGTSYGEILSFTAGAPIGVTKTATSVTGSSARLNGTVNRNGDADTTALFCLSDAEDVGADGSLLTCISSTDVDFTGLSASTNTDISVFVDASSLVAGNTYFFQIKATGTNGTTIGQVFDFSTGYTVQFVANGGSGSMNDLSATTTTALTANAFSKASSTFAGWSRTSGGSVEFADGATYDFSANLTLYAIWNAVATPAPTTPTVKLKAKLTWGNPSAIKQGTPLSGSQLNAVTDVPSVCVYSPALGTVLPAGTYALTVTCTPNDSNYEPITGTVTLIVKGKVKPQILWFNPSAIINPTPLSGTQLNALANVPGKYSYNPPAGTILAPGKHALNVKFTPDNREDNEDMESNVTIEVLEKKDAKPVVPPTKPVSTPDTKTVSTPAPAVILQTAGKSETITVRQNEEKTGIIVSSADWSLAIKSTTQFVQGNVEDTSARVVIEKGNTVTTSGTGFKPFSQVDVWVYSTPTWLGAVMTDQFGNFTTTLPMPNSLPEGDHTFQAKGQTPESAERTAAIPITLVPATVVNKPGSLRFEVYFGMNSPVVTKAEQARITKLVQFAAKKIAAGSKVTVEVNGWVQPNPNPGDIKYLSTNRAKNVAAVIKALGIKGSYTLKYPGLAKDNIPSARHASVIINWSKSK
jgi:outer membrane protein OmpA-like peptidoglycan-associated protein